MIFQSFSPFLNNRLNPFIIFCLCFFWKKKKILLVELVDTRDEKKKKENLLSEHIRF